MSVDPRKLADRLRPSFRQDAVRHLNRRSLRLMLDLGYHFRSVADEQQLCDSRKQELCDSLGFYIQAKAICATWARRKHLTLACTVVDTGTTRHFLPDQEIPGVPRDPDSPPGRSRDRDYRSRPNRETEDLPIPDSGRVGNRGFPPRFPAKSGIGGTVTGIGDFPGLLAAVALRRSANQHWRFTTMRKEASSVLRAQ